jgi:predicted alpha/beta superfamily hydrolase
MKKLLSCLLLIIVCSPAFCQLKKTKDVAVVKPFVLGVIDELPSKELNETRILNIYLPAGYNVTDTTTYPVTYLLDGSADEDFIHVAGIFQFNNFDWIDRVPKSILVGIATVNRRRDFTLPTTIATDKAKYPESGHSDNFIRFIEKELQPFIAIKYRGKGERTIIGQSLGGLLATEILLTKPALFQKYIIVSPSLWWNDGSLLTDSLSSATKMAGPTSVYIGVGKEGVWPGKHPHVMEVDANLLTDKLQAIKNNNLRVFFEYLPNEDHATIAHQAIFNAFRLLYPVVDSHK